MAYQATPRTERHHRENRDRIVDKALSLISLGGYQSVQMPKLAEMAGMAVGTLYRYFPSKEALFDEVFRRASQVEIDHCMAAAGNSSYGPLDRLVRVIEVFVYRALRGPGRAYALLIEPIALPVQTARLDFRRQYDRLFVSLLDEAIAQQEIPVQDTGMAAQCLVGSISEVVGRMVAGYEMPAEPDKFLDQLMRCCLRTVGVGDADSARLVAGMDSNRYG